MKHLKLFETETAFDAAKGNIDKPYVALTEDDDKVHMGVGEPLPFELVDLGLPSGTKWASCNLGATKPEEYGDYYMWGSVTPNTDDVCDWAHAPFNNGSSNFDQTYFNAHKSEWLDGDILKPEYDAAYQATGGKAHMPTKADFSELLDNTNNERVTNYNDSGINGYLFRSQKDMDKYIFIPASGSRYGSSFINQDHSYVWSSSLLSDYPKMAWCLNNYYISSNDSRQYGFPMRPVSN